MLSSPTTAAQAEDLDTDNDAGRTGPHPDFETGLDEAEASSLNESRTRFEAGKCNYRDFAIFLRINALTRAWNRRSSSSGMPFQIVRGLAFFERKENRDVLAYLRLIANPRDDISFLRAVNEPARGIGKVSLDHLARLRRAARD